MLGRRTGGPADGRTVRPHRRAGWSRMLSVIRRISGMPDYAAHLEHLRQCHPGQPIPTERQFYEEFLRTRYADGPTRCC
jgi:uncharacterized short protein YbdD (DUF466 family)